MAIVERGRECLGNMLGIASFQLLQVKLAVFTNIFCTWKIFSVQSSGTSRLFDTTSA
jgi:hypothetical protein